MSEIYIVATELGEVPALVGFLNLDSAKVTALVVGSRELAEEASAVAASVKWIDVNNGPADNYVSAAANLLIEAAPAAMIGVASPGTRAIIGKAAVGMGRSVVSNLTSVIVNDDVLLVEHSILGDKMIETVEVSHQSGLLVNPFSLPPMEGELTAAPESIEEIQAQSDCVVEYVSVEPVTVSGLQTADVVVGVGLGASSAELFAQGKQLAEVMGAELGCSMPVYNELQLLPHESYIGITGTKIAPKLYIALGISGTSQHCAGVRNAKTIVCVNKDPKALFFNHADYGIVGDLKDVLPELIFALSK